MKAILYYIILFYLIIFTHGVKAQNPLIRDQFTADPSARVFNDSVYIYPSHDIRAMPWHGRAGWFCMEDYHVFSSKNLTTWIDHGVILSQNKVPWADSSAYSMWAPDCIDHNGKYYFYFPTVAKEGVNGKGFTVGVAIADHPYGPFTPEKEPIKGVHGIDPNVFIDKDGKPYIYYAQGNIYAARLTDDMLQLSGSPVILDGLPNKGLKEGPYLFERNGIYYLTYPHVANKTERLEYAMSNSPLGPFKYAGVIMDESVSGCWTNHQSIIQYHHQWYLFYHDNELSPHFDKNRSIRADSLFFNTDGTIRKVIPTMRGVGITPANARIQIDRYSKASGYGVSVSYIDTTRYMKGWKVTFSRKSAWICYSNVDFGKIKTRQLEGMVSAPEGAEVNVRIDGEHGPVIAKMKLNPSNVWTLVKFNVSKPPFGKHNLFVESDNNNSVDIDWLSFR
jgi:hypothetical protein